MSKEHIISEIRRTAKINNGKPLGIDRFFEETGIRKEDWYGKYWAKWSDAQLEAGLQPNQFGEPAINLDEGIVKIATLIRQLGKVPTKPELKLAKRSDNDFPSTVTILKRLGNKGEMVERVFNFCIEHNDWTDVTNICQSYLNQIVTSEEIDDEELQENSLQSGHVYLLKHDKAFKIGRSTDATRRYNDIRVQMPMETEEIHLIETDDTVGIEAYWHKRFASKRLKGEWFSLNSADVKAFKRRRFM
jgi:hypothetical protein